MIHEASQPRYGFARAWSSPGSQRAVQIERSADQCEVREGLREVSQGLATMTGLFRIEAKMVGKAEHPLENQSRFLEPRPVVATGTGQRPLFAVRPPFSSGSSVASNVASMRGSVGDMKKVSAIIRLAASSDSLP